MEENLIKNERNLKEERETFKNCIIYDLISTMHERMKPQMKTFLDLDFRADVEVLKILFEILEGK